ncbi:MAG: lamin tail domain-containing protein [Candidatus Aenigmatarchaeota archaeon]
MRVAFMLASIIASLVTIPFISQQLDNSYTPTGALLLNINTSDVYEIPGYTKSFEGPERIEREIQTPYGKFYFYISSDEVFQKLSKGDSEIIVKSSSNYTEWSIKNSDILLYVIKTPSKIVERCESKNGYIERSIELGSISEKYYGLHFDDMNKSCEKTKTILQSEVERMEGMKKQMLNIPPKVVINEFFIKRNESNYTYEQWVELYNNEVFSVNLSTWKLETKKSESNTTYYCDLNGITIEAKGYVVINCTDKLGLTKGIIMLKKDDTIVDQVTYGSFDDGIKSDNAPKPSEDRAVGRCPNGSDSDVDILDFKEMTPTPGDENIC